MHAPDKPLAIALMGPTASGKTRLAMAIAEKISCEIISVDSALIYRGMDIGTAKPTLSERRQVPHHLIDILDPTQTYSVAQFCQDTLQLIADVLSRNRLPLLVGGTMMYFNTLRTGLNTLPPADLTLRARIHEETAQLGQAAMYDKLNQLDPVTAARLKPNDTQRIQRAIEIITLSGQPMSQLISQPPEHNLPVTLCSIALEPSNRSVLHERIATRFDAMLTQGAQGTLLDEVRTLRARGDLDPNLPSMRCVGYRQAWAHLDGIDDYTTFREKSIIATRQLAKRQLTWLRAMPERMVIDCLDTSIAEKIIPLIQKKLTQNSRAHQ